MTRGAYTPRPRIQPPPPPPAAPGACVIKFDVGKTCHGQNVELIASRQPNGKMLYSIKKHAANQLDETVTIFNIEPETMDRINQAVQVIKRL